VAEQELTVEELATQLGTKVSTVRLYQRQGVLPAPTVRGRVAYYGPGHVARLRLIAQLQEARSEVARLAANEERLRIARDLHDIVAHNMSVIAVRATVADHIADDQPQEMRESLRVIAATSREALVELRRALGTLRVEAVVAPTPGLADLGGLVESARSAKLAVELEVRGDPEVPEGVGVAVFRMVQEALTNVIKHARATTCRVDIDIERDELRLEVTDDGSAGPKENGQGQGLIGMRERAALFGGDLVAGPAPTGGWVVATTLRYAS